MASPALLNILNHFGSSVFSYKPSAIVGYSMGQWEAAEQRTVLGQCYRNLVVCPCPLLFWSPMLMRHLVQMVCRNKIRFTTMPIALGLNWNGMLRLAESIRRKSTHSQGH